MSYLYNEDGEEQRRKFLEEQEAISLNTNETPQKVSCYSIFPDPLYEDDQDYLLLSTNVQTVSIKFEQYSFHIEYNQLSRSSSNENFHQPKNFNCSMVQDLKMGEIEDEGLVQPSLNENLKQLGNINCNISPTEPQMDKKEDEWLGRSSSNTNFQYQSRNSNTNFPSDCQKENELASVLNSIFGYHGSVNEYQESGNDYYQTEEQRDTPTNLFYNLITVQTSACTNSQNAHMIVRPESKFLRKKKGKEVANEERKTPNYRNLVPKKLSGYWIKIIRHFLKNLSIILLKCGLPQIIYQMKNSMINTPIMLDLLNSTLFDLYSKTKPKEYILIIGTLDEDKLAEEREKSDIYDKKVSELYSQYYIGVEGNWVEEKLNVFKIKEDKNQYAVISFSLIRHFEEVTPNVRKVQQARKVATVGRKLLIKNEFNLL